MNRIEVWIKEGVMGDLHPMLQKELGKIIEHHEENGYVNFYILSKREGDHKPGSLHVIGQAVDFASDMPYDRLRAIVGLDFDLKYYREKSRYHLEYSPLRYGKQ